MTKRIAYLGAASILALLCHAYANAPAGQEVATEDQIKAAYLFNFPKFVEWPDGVFAAVDSPITFCAMGRSQTADEMDALVRGKSINAHPVKILHLGNPEQIKECNLAFVTAGNGKQQQQLLQAAKGRPILLVGDSQGFARAGGMIGFIKEDGRVLFEVNPNSAEESHLKISSKLLALARIVSSGTERAGP